MVKISSIEIGDFPLILAPMEEISDPPFRMICKNFGADMVYSEFISSEAIIRKIPKSLRKAVIFTEERPIAIQIYGYNEKSMKEAAEHVEQLNPDFIDLNFGCPVKKVITKGAGAGALKDIPNLVKMAESVVRSTKIPVTVKTRLGWDNDSICIPELAEMLQDVGIQALAIHARTAKQKYQGKADWSWIGKTLENPRLKIPVFGNGDVINAEIALEMKNKYPVSGIMVGRAAVGNPWLFSQIKHYFEKNELLPFPSINERIDVCYGHLLKSAQWKNEQYAVREHRKYYKNYFKGLADFRIFKMKLMEVYGIEEVKSIFDEIKAFYSLIH